MAATAAAVAVAAEEDTELRDLLVQTLENSGVLNRIKAELRAAVFLALEEQEKVENKTPLVNESLKKFLNTKDGRLVASLVAEFLQFFNLDFTLAVFQPETSTLQSLDARENLARDLGIIEAEGTVGGPLLLEVLRRCQQKEKGFICREGALTLSEVPSPPKSPDGKAGTHSSTSKKTSTEASDTSISSSDSRSRSSRHMSSPESRAGTLLSRTSVGHNSVGPGADDEPDGDSFFDDPVLEPQSARGWIHEPGKQTGSLASLTDAPLLKSGLSSLAGAPSLKDPEGECASPGWPCYFIISGPGVFLRKTVTEFREALSARSHMSAVPACCVLSTRTCCLPLHCTGPTGSPRAQEGTVTCYSLDRALPASSTGQHGADGNMVACQRGCTVLKDPRVTSEDAGTHGPGAGEDDYADDFNSSHRSERSELSIGEEIEEDLSVGVDELNASDKLDELTQDLSMSQLSDVADYLEDVA